MLMTKAPAAACASKNMQEMRFGYDGVTGFWEKEAHIDQNSRRGQLQAAHCSGGAPTSAVRDPCKGWKQRQPQHVQRQKGAQQRQRHPGEVSGDDAHRHPDAVPDRHQAERVTQRPPGDHLDQQVRSQEADPNQGGEIRLVVAQQPRAQAAGAGADEEQRQEGQPLPDLRSGVAQAAREGPARWSSGSSFHACHRLLHRAAGGRAVVPMIQHCTACICSGLSSE